MPYLLASTELARPQNVEESNSSQFAQVRTLAGLVGRDYFGSNKRVWALDYANKQPATYATIRGIYDTYLSTGTTQTWQITEANYTISQTSVHIDLARRRFNVKGASYISDFSLILTEA